MHVKESREQLWVNTFDHVLNQSHSKIDIVMKMADEITRTDVIMNVHESLPNHKEITQAAR